MFFALTDAAHLLNGQVEQMWRGVSAGQEVAIRVAGSGGAGEQGEEEPASSQATLRTRRQVNSQQSKCYLMEEEFNLLNGDLILRVRNC